MSEPEEVFSDVTGDEEDAIDSIYDIIFDENDEQRDDLITSKRKVKATNGKKIIEILVGAKLNLNQVKGIPKESLQKWNKIKDFFKNSKPSNKQSGNDWKVWLKNAKAAKEAEERTKEKRKKTAIKRREKEAEKKEKAEEKSKARETEQGEKAEEKAKVQERAEEGGKIAEGRRLEAEREEAAKQQELANRQAELQTLQQQNVIQPEQETKDEIDDNARGIDKIIDQLDNQENRIVQANQMNVVAQRDVRQDVTDVRNVRLENETPNEQPLDQAQFNANEQQEQLRENVNPVVVNQMADVVKWLM
jgi:hypothetical protein